MKPGLFEFLLIGGVVLLIFGPKRIVSLAKSYKKGLKEFHTAATEEDESEKSKSE